MASDADHILRHCSKQRPGLFQVCCVDTLGEPVVNLSQQLSGFVALTLALPPPTQAHRRPQLQRLSLLAAGHIEGLMETLPCQRHLLSFPLWLPLPFSTATPP
jgi:hypothetical protein